jgi:hypothetical protein
MTAAPKKTLPFRRIKLSRNWTRSCLTAVGEVGNRVLSITFENFAAYGAAVDKMGEDKKFELGKLRG